jgi:hypothetical protein
MNSSESGEQGTTGTDLVIRDEGQYLATVEAVRALAERVTSVGDAKTLADKARAVEVWAQRAKLGTDQVNRAAAAKLWAERRAGELLRDATETGARQRRGGDRRSESKSQAATLNRLGVTKHESSRWQKLAAVPAADFQNAIEKAVDEGTVSATRVTELAEGISHGDPLHTYREREQTARRADQNARARARRQEQKRAASANPPAWPPIPDIDTEPAARACHLLYQIAEAGLLQLAVQVADELRMNPVQQDIARGWLADTDAVDGYLTALESAESTARREGWRNPRARPNGLLWENWDDVEEEFGPAESGLER